MNSNDKKLIIRLDERVKSIQQDIGELKGMIGKVSNCINTNELSITKLDTKFSDHIKSHDEINQISRKNWAIVATIAGAVSAGVAMISLLISVVLHII